MRCPSDCLLTPLIDRIPVSLDARGHGLEEVVAITARARHRVCIHLSGSCKLRLGRFMTSSVPCPALGGRGSGLVLGNLRRNLRAGCLDIDGILISIKKIV